MEDDKKERTSITRSRATFYKVLTIVFASLVLLIVAGYATVEETSSKSFCSTCHEMKPEAETLKASSHSNVECKECHIQSGVVNYAKAKMNGLVQVYEKVTNSYSAPIHMPTEIPNATCEKCHDMKTRNVTPAGDLIIPHDKHLDKNIKCVQCHSGVAHGNIADRNVTFKTDYDKWNDSLGKSVMSDTKFTEPTMEDCISCHAARKISTDCKTCHKTEMLPESHNAVDFKTGGHGKLAEKDIRKCNQCHSLMSKDQLKGYQDPTVLDSFLNKDKPIVQKNADDYAKENSFCRDCHSKKPASHTSDFFKTHGTTTKNGVDTCKACHNVNKTNTSNSTAGGNKVACATCHPASHDSVEKIQHHPISLDGVKGPSQTCYKCHAENKCKACHKEE
jgi:nitrate/TMAO reductase-like tetraheme cytochrome c subunit